MQLTDVLNVIPDNRRYSLGNLVNLVQDRILSDTTCQVLANPTKLIERIFHRQPLRTIPLIYDTDSSLYYIVDPKDKDIITTLYCFITEPSFPLEDLADPFKDLNGSTFLTLPESIQRKILEYNTYVLVYDISKYDEQDEKVMYIQSLWLDY